MDIPESLVPRVLSFEEWERQAKTRAINNCNSSGDNVDASVSTSLEERTRSVIFAVLEQRYGGPWDSCTWEVLSDHWNMIR